MTTHSIPYDIALYHRRVWNNPPVDPQGREYWPDWAGDQLQTFVRWPGLGVQLLLTQEPTPPELIAQIKERSTHG